MSIWKYEKSLESEIQKLNTEMDSKYGEMKQKKQM